VKSPINLDHAAGAPLAKEAKNKIKEFIENPIYNTDSSYAPAVEQRRYLADLKSKTAKLIGAKAPNIFITTGSSDANSKLLNLIKLADPNAEVITTSIEHSSLLDSIKELQSHKILELNKDGQFDLKTLESSITDSTILITVQYINNETGQILPIKEISRLVKKINNSRLDRKIKTPLFFHTDASQAAITEDLLIPRLGVDSISLNGSKFGALPNSGILYLSAEILRFLELKKVTIPKVKESPLSIISTYFALKNSIEKKNTESKRLLKLSNSFYSQLQKDLPDIKLNPSNLKIGKNHSPHILNINIPNVSGEKLVILAGLNKILISTGAACSASKDQPSHVLEALSLSLEQINSSIRVSFGSGNKSEKEVIEAAKNLAKLCKNPSIKL
jgi:cysteine desulfurase